MRSLGWAASACAGLVLVQTVGSVLDRDGWQRAHLGGPLLVVVVATFVVPLLVLSAARVPLGEAGLTVAQPARWLEVSCMALAPLGVVTGLAFAGAAGLGDVRRLPAAAVVAAGYLVAFCLMGPFLRRTRRVEGDLGKTLPGGRRRVGHAGAGDRCGGGGIHAVDRHAAGH